MFTIPGRKSALRLFGWGTIGLQFVACGTTSSVTTDGGAVILTDAEPPPSPINDAGATDANAAADALVDDADADSSAVDAGECVLIQSGNRISGCEFSHVSLVVNLSKVRDGGSVCSDPATCCETSTEEADASAPVPISFDLDTGALTWNGRVFEALTKVPPAGDSGAVVYRATAPKNTSETVDAGASVLLASDASLTGYSGMIPRWLTARSGGGGGVAGETVQFPGTVTEARFDPVAGTLTLTSFRLPNLVTGSGCNPSAKITLRTGLAVLRIQDAGRD